MRLSPEVALGLPSFATTLHAWPDTEDFAECADRDRPCEGTESESAAAQFPFGLRLVIAKVRVTSSCNIRRRDRPDRRRRFASAAIPLENPPPLMGDAVPATAAAGLLNAHRRAFTSVSNFLTSSQTCHDVVEVNVECGRKPVQSEF